MNEVPDRQDGTRTSTLETKTVIDTDPTTAAPGDDHPLAPGTSAGRYVVLERLGIGGMGYVYSAYDPDLDRRVALKILRPDRQNSEVETRKAQARLLREARVLAKLQHPNVISIYDVGTLDGQVFLAMAFVEGENLEHWMRRRERPWRQVLNRFISAGRGLAAAHAAGLVHRDFKPANVMLGNDGQVRVVDFGLARRCTNTPPPGTLEPCLDPETSSASDADLFQTLTRTGAVLGTPAYMAPEQHQRENPDARTDQFAYCVALYEALYGERPFQGSNLRETQLRVLSGELRETPYNSTVPPWLRTALLRGLETSPEARYPSMDDLLDALENHPERARRRKNQRARTLGMTGIGLLLGFGVAFLVSTAYTPRNTKVSEPAPVAAPEGPTEEEIQAKIEQIRVRMAAEMEGQIREQYDQQLTDLQEQLAAAQAAEALRLEQLEQAARQADAWEAAATAERVAAIAAAEEATRRAAEEAARRAAEEEAAEAAAAAAAATAEPEVPSSALPFAPDEPQVHRGQLVKLGPGVTPPEPVRRVLARFPEMAKRFNRTEAKVQIRVLIDEHGDVVKAELRGARQGYGFDEEALSAMRKSTYRPATKNGVPVKVWKTLTVEFRNR